MAMINGNGWKAFTALLMLMITGVISWHAHRVSALEALVDKRTINMVLRPELAAHQVADSLYQDKTNTQLENIDKKLASLLCILDEDNCPIRMNRKR